MPLPGVTVVVKETQKGTNTNFDGAYSITVEKGQTLVFDFIGCHQQSIKVGDDTVINVTLKEDNQTLQDVVVTGYASGSKNRNQKVKRQLKSRIGGINIRANPKIININKKKYNTKHQPGQHGTNDQEDYNSLIENAFESPKTAPLSTFSIDVDNASYTKYPAFY